VNLVNSSQFAAFINGSYGVSVVFLIAVCALTFGRYRRAARRLAAAEAAK
jgi:hypothetical protein